MAVTAVLHWFGNSHLSTIEVRHGPPYVLPVSGPPMRRFGNEQTRAEALVIAGVSPIMPMPTKWLARASAALLSASFLVSAVAFVAVPVEAAARGKGTAH